MSWLFVDFLCFLVFQQFATSMQPRRPKTHEDGPEKAPRRLQDRPRTLQEGPREPKTPSARPQDGPRGAPESAKRAPVETRRPQEGPESGRRRPKTDQESSWTGRRWPQTVLGRQREASKRPREPKTELRGGKLHRFSLFFFPQHSSNL